MPSVPLWAVAIGASTGGPNALVDLLPRFPSELPASILIVQHIHPKFISILTRRLVQVSPLSVKEAVHDEVMRSGFVYIAVGDHHMEVERKGVGIAIRLHKKPPLHGVRPSADLLFSSVSEAFAERAIAVILTGMGQDGLAGARMVKNRGGTVLAEARESCVIYGMPRAVVEAGLADRVVPLKEIPQEILKVIRG